MVIKMSKEAQMKPLSKLFFVLYLLTLLWLVLFKLSTDFSSVLFDHQARSLNLIPFIISSQANPREMLDNFMIFVPFGLLLGVYFKQVRFWQKLAVIFTFSFIVETMQFILAIGVTDITDLITNTLGGLFGLLVYDFGKKHLTPEKLDRAIIITGMILLALLLIFRFFVLRVRY
jgi:glycopeptide antibiotics resistance protein